MKVIAASITLLAVVALTELCMAIPAARDDSSTPTETEILNFALTLEHLENAFYTQGLQKYTQEDFVDAGLPTWARGRWNQIAQHETTHVSFLESVLGDEAVQPCTYEFPDIKTPSPICQQCHQREETVHHFLLVCPSYVRQRNILLREIAPRANHLKNLLNNQKCIKPLLRFIASTRRLEQAFGDVTPPVDDDAD